MSDERLYGPPGAEHLQGDLDSAADAADFGEYPILLEEWTVAEPRLSDGDLARALETLTELAAEEGDEWYAEAWIKASEREDVRAAFRAAADLLASHVHYRMAGELVARWHAWPDDGSWRFAALGAEREGGPA